MLQMLIGAAAGGLFFYFGHQTLAIVIWLIAGTIGLGSWISEGFRDGVARVGEGLSLAVGSLLRVLLLFPFYLLVMGPYAGIRRLFGADRLGLRPIDCESFWVDRRGDRGDYTRPY